MKDSNKRQFKAGISVVIPCLNERETLAGVIGESFLGISRCGLDGEVIVADNGSTDGSQKVALESGASVVYAPIKGYGAALDAGISAANYSIVVFADADLSYPLLEIKDLVQPLIDGSSDFVLGSRLRGKIEDRAMPFLNRFLGTPVLSFLIFLLFGLKTSDCNSGMRALRRKDYELLSLKMTGMEYASEMLVRARQCQLRYAEVPINFRRDQRGRPSHLHRWRDGMRHLRFLLGNSDLINGRSIQIQGISFLFMALLLFFT